MELEVQDAARRLGLSPRQAQRMAAAGSLQVTRRVGRSVLVDSGSLQAAVRTGRGPGRRWDARTAWAAVDLLERDSTERLTGSTLSRLRGRLRTLDADDLLRLASRRAQTRRAAATRRTRAALEAEMALSGASLLDRSLPSRETGRELDVAGRLGLSGSTATTLEGYVHADDAGRLVDRFGLVDDGEGDVLLHVSDEPVTTGWVTTALDLAERGSTREASAALALLEDLLERYREPSAARKDGRR